jgi:hypothetical protein
MKTQIRIKREEGKVVPIDAIKAYIRGVEIKVHSSLTLALDGDEWPASRPGRFMGGKESPVPIK